MSESQAAETTAGRNAQSEQAAWKASWESPADPASPGSSASPGLIKGVLSPSILIAFARRNGRMIAILSALLFAAGIAVLMILPVRYAATALVVVDPREQRVTADQDVLPGIGQDAAALQSVIEIAKSDGFLRPLIDQLKVASDTEIADGETDPSRVLDKFRSHLDISRRGLTYVIAMTFVSKDPERAARYANAVAQAFVLSQTQVRTTAADEAAGWLNSRLKTLSDRLRISEDAVAAFKAEHRIVNAGRESTTRQLRVTELSQQVSAARLRAEEAKNRYDQAQRDLKANVDSPSGSRSDLLNILRAQRTQLNDQIAQKRAVFGDRHPDLVIAYNQLTELNRQIETERKRNIDSAKSDFETMRDQQRSLEQQLKSLEGEMLADGQASVKLQELQREADANRNIYEQFLSRFNTTSEQRLLQATQTKVASIATAPTRPTRPSMPLLLIALAIGSVLSSTAIVTLLEAGRVLPAASRPRPPSKAGPPPSKTEPVMTTLDPESEQDLPVWSRVPALASQPREAVDLRPHLRGLLDSFAVKPGQRGKVVLLTSAEAGVGKTAIAQALNALAIERGLLSVLIQVSPEPVPVQARELPSDQDPRSGVRSLKTTVRSLQLLLGATPNNPRGPSDARSEFALIVIDAPSLAMLPDAAAISAQADFTILVARDDTTSAEALRDATVALARFGNVRTGIVVNRVAPKLTTLDLREMARRAG